MTEGHRMDHTRILGIDVGGTFTDLILVDGAQLRIAKVPSAPGDQASGVMAAIGASDTDLSAVDLLVHGTTVATNALLERKLAKTGLITTKGFRDVLELGRRTRPQAYGMTALDEAAVTAQAQALLAAGCTAIVVHFLHSYANPAHEARAGEIIRALWPNPYVTLGHELLSESREFERGVTAAVNGAVQPIIDTYVRDLSTRLTAGGLTRPLQIMNGNGGMVAAADVAREAAKTAMSGPASGVIAASHIARRAGLGKLLTYDMGGTSTDVALIDGDPSLSTEIEIEYAMPIHLPMVDVRTVGAGGAARNRRFPMRIIFWGG